LRQLSLIQLSALQHESFTDFAKEIKHVHN
jgi:hypothetical protein